VTRIVIAGLTLLSWICLLPVARRLWSRRDRTVWRRDERVPLRWKRVVLMIALVALPAATVIVILPFAACVGGGIDVGITLHDGECVGVTDGRYKFSGYIADQNAGDETRKRLDNVENLIQKQNEIRGDFVKVAFLAPMASPLSGPRAADELEGAAAAQKWINTDGRGSPKIQLLLADMGSAEKQWEPVVQQLIAMKDDQVPLVAVIGLGLSQNESKLTAERLAVAGIPMVANAITATELDPGKNVKGFHRVSYQNAQQVDALFRSLDNSHTDLRNAVVVQSDDPSDEYARQSAEAFVRDLSPDKPDLSRYPQKPPVPELFGDPKGDPGKLANQFALISQSLCSDKNAVVFYAGRARFLSNFMQKLDTEPCLGSVLVVSASDAAVLRMVSGDETAQQKWGIDAALKVLKGSKVSLRYPPLADPDLLMNSHEYMNLQDAFHAEKENENDLRTGWAITSWDALKVVAQWVWRAQSAAQPELPHAEDVTQASTQEFTNEKKQYHGASGNFWFDDKGNRGGDPPKVVQLMGDGTIQVK